MLRSTKSDTISCFLLLYLYCTEVVKVICPPYSTPQNIKTSEHNITNYDPKTEYNEWINVGKTMSIIVGITKKVIL